MCACSICKEVAALAQRREQRAEEIVPLFRILVGDELIEHQDVAVLEQGCHLALG